MNFCFVELKFEAGLFYLVSARPGAFHIKGFKGY